MGIDISGGMIVGLEASEIDWDEVRTYLENTNEFDEDFEEAEDHELAEYVEFERMSPYYDSDFAESIVGYKIEDVYCSSLNLEEFFKEVNKLASVFKKITGETPKLIGCQNVW